MQFWLRESLKRRLHKSLACDWMREETEKSFPLREFYVQLEWQRKVRRVLRTEKVTLHSIHELIEQMTEQNQQATGKPKSKTISNVIIEGDGGIGKTSSLGMVALDWAENTREELNKFTFVFLISLRHVNGTQPLEAIILEQHGRLKTEGVTLSEIKAIMRTTGHNILILIDGYDEYTPGTNEQIDEMLLHGKGNCFIILTSRPGDYLKPLKNSMDEEVEISGFSYENIIKCAQQYLGQKQSCAEFLSQAEQAGIHTHDDGEWLWKYKGLLHIPIILLMACTVFSENKCLPSSKTGLFQQVIMMCIGRTTKKTMGKTASEVENLHILMFKLGKLAWEALNRENKQLLIFKSNVISESEEILKLGLLFGEDIDATTEDFHAVLSFQHKLIQEYLAAVYIAENVKLDTAGSFLTEAFPSLEQIKTHIEVVLFACGILADSDARDSLINCVAKCTAEYNYKELCDGKDIGYMGDTSILERCQKESGMPVYTMNKHLSLYPACRKPLTEVLSNTEVAYIDGIAKNDTLQLSASEAKIIVRFEGRSDPDSDSDSDSDTTDDNKFDRLWEALNSINANVIALHLNDVQSANETKLHNFFKLEYLRIQDIFCSEEVMEDLSHSINSWSPQPQLMYCELGMVPIPESVLTALSKCTKLSTLKLSWSGVSGKLSVLMESPPPELQVLSLRLCSLQAADVDLITQAVRRNSLNKLQKLHLGDNPIGEVALGFLLEALISTRAQTNLDLLLIYTGADEDGSWTELSDQFISKWKKRFKDTAIDATWNW